MKLQTSVKAWSPQGFEGLEILHVTNSYQPLLSHHLEAYWLAAGLGGPARTDYRGSRLSFSKLSRPIATCQLGEVYSSEPVDGGAYSYLVLCLSEPMVTGLIEAMTDHTLPLPNFPNLTAPSEQVDKHLWSTLTLCYESFEEPSTRLERESRLLMTFNEFTKYCADTSQPVSPLRKEHRAVKLVKDFLRDCYHEDITLADLAQLTGLNKSHLLEVFKHTVGVSPHQYLTGVRVQRAKLLLARGAPIAQAAFETGFADQSHLNRQFKKYVQVTPGQFQRDSLKS